MSGYETEELGRIEAALDDLVSPSSEDVWQATRPYDERAIASVAATRAGGGGGGGNVPFVGPDPPGSPQDGELWWDTDDDTPPGGLTPNWCLVQIAIPPDPLTVANYSPAGPLAADLQIIDQSGSDFSVGTYQPDASPFGAILSAAGGLFQAGAYVRNPSDATLDGGSAQQRYLVFGASVGEGGGGGGLNSLGVDTVVPILDSGGDPFGLDAVTHAGLPGVVSPGGPACWGIFVALINSFGSDSVPLDLVYGWPMLAVWQVS